MCVLGSVYCSFSFAIYIYIYIYIYINNNNKKNYLIVFYQKILIAEKLMIPYLIVFMIVFMICNYPWDQFSHAYLIMSNESYTLLRGKCVRALALENFNATLFYNSKKSL